MDNIGKYRDILEEGLFLDDDNGSGVEFRTGKMTLPDSGNVIDSIKVLFSGPDGYTPLGEIFRDVNNFGVARVFAYYRSRESDHTVVQADRYETINILDARWEAIVDPVGLVREQLDMRMLPRNLQEFDARHFFCDEE